MSTCLTLLVIEDKPADFRLIVRHLEKHGLTARCHCVSNIEELEAAVAQGGWDAVLSDYSVPKLDFQHTLGIFQERHPDLPLILVSGSVGEERAVELLKLGVWDFVLKDSLARLVPAIQRGLRDAADRVARRQSEAAQRASELRYRRLFESAKDGILILDAGTGMIVDVNPFLIEMLGFSHEAFLGKKVWELGFFKDIIANQDNFAKLQEEEYISYDNMALETADGRRIEVEFVSNVYLVSGHKVVQCNIRDISERVRTEETFNKFFEQPMGLNVIAKLDGVIHRVNKGMEDLLGYGRGHLAGVNFLDLVHPDDQAATIAGMGKLAQGINILYFENRYRQKNGDFRLFAWSASVSTADRMIFAVATDITERKRAEESRARLATAVEQAGETIVITDTSGTILYANPAFEQTSGYTRAEAIGQNPRLLKSGKQDAEFYRQIWEVLKRGQVWRGHFTNKRKDGKLYEEEATISPVRDPKGTIVNYVAVKRDVTRELELEAQFRQAQKLEAIGQLAGGIAHDFNNILAAILGNAQLAVADTDPSHPARESLEEILKAGVRAKGLVQQILTFSRKQLQNRQVISLEPIIAEAAKFLHATIPSGVEIVLELAASAPPVLADATQIHQVIFNLCTNAWHALEDRPGRIDIELQTVTLDAVAAERLAGLRPGRFACLSISDTGKGMDAATLEHIFNPFFTTKAPGKGTGLGLSVVQGIVAAHDGAITVVSQPGQGTTFQVYFPAAFAGTADSPIAPEGPVHHGQGQHVLFLDDEEALVFLATRTLEWLGYRATGFTDAADAVQAFRANPGQFDVVVTDLNMPSISGLDVARELLIVRPDVPVLLCSGHVTEQMHAQALLAGIRHVLYKPNTMEELSATLRHLFTHPRPTGPKL